MCYDISFTTSIRLLSDYFPGLVLDPQLNLDFGLIAMHVQAQAFKEYPIIIDEEGVFKTKLFEWGVIAGYMNTPDKIK